ncbi:MAG: hypothetical protein JWR84_2473 [Caulobacter sp.]|nr:hypothetical protein [Caulobacter sp.]
MSLIDPSPFKAEPEAGGGTPFAPSAYVGPRGLGADFKDPRPLTAWTNGFIWADTAFSALLGLMLLAQVFGIAEVIPLDETVDLTPGQLAFSLTAMAYIGFIFVRMLIVLRWFWRANKNARALSSGIETTPGWAWGFFFIPLMNLWRPFQTMEEIWASSQSPHNWRTVETPVLMRWWWGVWLLSNMADNLAGRFMDKADSLQFGAAVGVLGYGLSVACNLLFQRLIDPVARSQWANSQEGVFD